MNIIFCLFSESGTDHTSDMDLSQGSLDLSRTGPYYNPPSTPQPPPVTLRPMQNTSPISPAQSEHSGCLDLSRSASSTPTTYMHYSGGTSINLSQGITQDQASYYQLPRIKLEPGLGIGKKRIGNTVLNYIFKKSQVNVRFKTFWRNYRKSCRLSLSSF